MKLVNRLIVGAGVAMTSVLSHAAAPDVSAVTSALEATAAPIAAIGAASLLVAVGIKTFKWIRKAL